VPVEVGCLAFGDRSHGGAVRGVVVPADHGEAAAGLAFGEPVGADSGWGSFSKAGDGGLVGAIGEASTEGGGRWRCCPGTSRLPVSAFSPVVARPVRTDPAGLTVDPTSGLAELAQKQQ
jgi:hypothetical protein